MSIDKTITEKDIAAALSQLPNARQESCDADKPLGDGFDLEAYLDGIRKRYLVPMFRRSRNAPFTYFSSGIGWKNEIYQSDLR